MPQFKYLLSQTNLPLSDRSQIWTAPLPQDRKSFSDGPESETRHRVRYKDYFQAAHIFLKRNRFNLLIKALRVQLKHNVTPEEIKEIRICLDKHGQFYHPARVEIIGEGFKKRFVLNVAVSSTGKKWIKTEYHNLKRLNKKTSCSYIPTVYGFGKVRPKNSEHHIDMVLGEWFDDYHEFHVSRDSKTRQHKVVVWDNVSGNYLLSFAQSVSLYKQAAEILTCYYNISSFEQIFSWHHAAGDFVLKLHGDQLDVKLVAVRQYIKLFKNTHEIEKNASLVLEALLVFFLNLSIRMRLDRIDGIGPVVWSGRAAVSGTVKGFFDALAKKPPVDELPGSVAVCFHTYLQTVSEKELLSLLGDIAETYSSDSPDIPVINQNLKTHAAELYKAFRQP